MTDAEKYRESIAMHYYGIVRDFVYDRLWPMLSTLEGRVSAIYSHLASRGCTLPSTPDTAHLLATVKQLDGRKVECYETDGIEDGEGIAEVLLGNQSSITKLIDKQDFDVVRGIPSTLTCLTEVELGVEVMDGKWFRLCNLSSVNKLRMPKLRVFSGVHGGTWDSMYLISGTSIKTVTLPNLEELHTSHTTSGFIVNNSTIEEVNLPKLRDIRSCSDNWGYTYLLYTSSAFYNCTALKKLITAIDTVGAFRTSNNFLSGCSSLEEFEVGKLKSWNQYMLGGLPNLIKFVVGEGTCISFSVAQWSPTLTDENLSTFLSNFEQYIVRRLADLTGKTAQTLTLSTAVYEAISASTAVAHNADGSTMYATADYSDFGTYDEAAGRTTAVTLLKALEKKQNWNVANA